MYNILVLSSFQYYDFNITISASSIPFLLGQYAPMIIIAIATLKQFQDPGGYNLVILALLLMDIFIINPTFKIMTGALGVPNYKRPMNSNQQIVPANIPNLINNFSKLGMPSGHMEITMTYLSYLYHYAPNERLLGIPLIWLITGLAIITGWQRVISKKHSIIQVLMGALTGWLLGKYLPKHINKIITQDNDDNDDKVMMDDIYLLSRDHV